ncbi:pilin [Parafrankia elaeagni]|uniref:pilin n=1 Tax=Parafrankia elaeagni TaxID=222534 RepID=UPI00037896EB|nr:pilin [Parafrankia elaeagni]
MSPTPPEHIRVPRPARRVGWHQAVLLVAVVGVFVLAGGAAALAAPPPAAPVAPDLNTVLNNIRNWIMGILALLATVFLSVGGVRYLIANGEPGEVGKAKDAFRNAGWGYGLAALAPVVVEVLKQIVGG